MKSLMAAARLAKANFARLETPLKVNLCLTYWCQYRCKTCNIWQRKPVDELSTEEMLTFVRRNRDIAWLDVTGGEIFLRKDAADILEAIVRSWPRLAVLHFPTNGFLTDTIVETARRLVQSARARIVITVSLDGDEALNDEVRGIKGGYCRQIETFNALRQLKGITTVFGFTLSRFNAGRLLETFDACRRDCPGVTIRDFHVNVAQTSSHYYGNADSGGLLPSLDNLRRELHAFHEMRGLALSPSAWVERRFMHHLDAFLETGRTPMRCHALRSSCFIDPWGTVYPCVTDSRRVGSLRETGMALAPLWNSDAARALQAQIWEGDCPQCWTACEAYQSILGNVLRPFGRASPVTGQERGSGVGRSGPRAATEPGGVQGSPPFKQ